ncbi:MAG: N-acetylmuramoyl-L-alanine amidase [Methylococcales bacterium]|nr:N-acetylmuramoyl-L-alanine amidase [Methylococcales bacterium]
MQLIHRFFLMLVLLPATWAAHADPGQITAISFSSQPTARIGFDLAGQTHQRFFTLSNPSRLVIDFLDMPNLPTITQPPADHPLFTNLRCAIRNGKNLRVVLELKADAEAKSSISKQANGSQLVFDLIPKDNQNAARTPATTPPPAASIDNQQNTAQPAPRPVKIKSAKSKARDIIVAIDAGHGGKDTGAQGLNGTLEKDVVFAIARHLENLVNNQPGMRAVMIRNGDYFVHLNERVRIAQAAKADLFISIHADAFNDPSAHGASVYTLAKKGASSQAARWLAESENAVDASNNEMDDTLSSVLHDLTRTAAKEASQNIGNKVLKSVKTVGHLHRSSVQKAGFVVLKSAEMPSILVETAFISNPDEERRLTSNAYQEKMASAVFGGIMAHFRQYAPADTLLARRSKSAKATSLSASENQEPSARNHLPIEAVPPTVPRLKS